MLSLSGLAAAFLVSAGIVTSAMAKDPAAGFLGSPLAEVVRSDFFGWFHLERTGIAPAADGGRVVSYKPDGPRFHKLTTIEVTVDKGDRVRRMDLWLLRSFIDNPRDAPFARDIAKSFLRDAPATADAAEIQPLADEIEHRTSGSETVIVGPGHEKPELPETPSAGYEAYRGARPSYEQALGHGGLAMTNEPGPDGDALRISLTAK